MTTDRRPTAPPIRRGVANDDRHVGIEIEFGGIDARTTATVLATTLEGTVRTVSAYEYVVELADGRTFRVELDVRWAHPDFVRQNLEDLPEDWRQGLDVQIADAVGAVAGTVMPVEIVAPPFAWHELGYLRRLSAPLAAAGAKGTAHSAFAGFGMHFNVEVAALDAGYLLSVLRAYVLSSPWLRRESNIATIRQIQSYIDPFPLAYARHILDPDYAPDEERLIRDHLHFNPSRDYELDMLPVFATIDAGLVSELLPNEKNAARPAFHWRLPNCRIDEPGWDPLADWDRWVTMETLAADGDRLAAEARAFLQAGPRTELEARLARIRDALGF